MKDNVGVRDAHVMTVSEILKEVEEKRKLFRQHPYVGDIRLCKKHKSIVIEGAGNGYDISLSRISDAKEAFGWLCHLHQKRWFTPQMHSDLTEMILRTTDVNEYCFKW